MRPRLFVETHHAALFRSIYYLFGDYLGYSIDIPTPDWCDKVDGWGNMNHGQSSLGGIDWPHFAKRITEIDEEAFLDKLNSYYFIIITRVETEKYIFPLLDRVGYKKPIIAFTGNENSTHDWSRIKNLIATDYQTFQYAPDSVHKIWTVQEIGRHFKPKRNFPSWQYLHINSYINHLPQHNRSFRWNADSYDGKCPHCSSSKPMTFRPINVPAMWLMLKDMLPDHFFNSYGAGCEGFGGRNIPDIELPNKYWDSGMTWHFKTFEGYGHSLIQSIACGIPVLIPKGFYNYRTARRFLIPNVTCFECDWSAVEIANTIKNVTVHPEILMNYHSACAHAAKSLFNWEHEARRVEDFLWTLR